MLFVISIGELQVVVESDNVEGVGDALLVVPVNGGRNDTGGVEFMNAADHGGPILAPCSAI